MPSIQKYDGLSSPVDSIQSCDGGIKNIFTSFLTLVQYWQIKLLTFLISILLTEFLSFLGNIPIIITFMLGFLFIAVNAIQMMLLAISFGEFLPRLFVPHWRMAFSTEVGISKFSILQRTCSTRSPPIPRLLVWCKKEDDICWYLHRPFTIESPIIKLFGLNWFIMFCWFLKVSFQPIL